MLALYPQTTCFYRALIHAPPQRVRTRFRLFSPQNVCRWSVALWGGGGCWNGASRGAAPLGMGGVGGVGGAVGPYGVSMGLCGSLRGVMGLSGSPWGLWVPMGSLMGSLWSRPYFPSALSAPSSLTGGGYGLPPRTQMCRFSPQNVAPAAAGRLLGAVRGHLVRRRLLAPPQRGAALRGGLQGDQEEVRRGLWGRGGRFGGPLLVLGVLGVFWGPFWGPLRPFWGLGGHFGTPGSHFGAPETPFGDPSDNFWDFPHGRLFWGHSNTILGSLGAILGSWWPLWGPLAAILGPL